MNKQLIITYFEEFKHWLNGGKILIHYGEWVPVALDAKWEFYISDLEKMGSFGYIIDDYYVEFRKALAEGKIVEYLGYKNEWKNLTENCRKLEGISLEELRIKSEESKFKVGDWVTDGIEIWKHKDNCRVKNQSSWALWEPKKEKYFWYKNDLVKFHKSQTNAGLLLHSARGCSYYPAEENFEDFCEPFIGQLPTHIKDSDET